MINIDKQTALSKLKPNAEWVWRGDDYKGLEWLDENQTKPTEQEILDKQIDEEIKKAEDEISKLKKTAPEKITKIAIETSSELIQKLIGAEVNNSSISAIVDDLSKKNRGKYYDN